MIMILQHKRIFDVHTALHLIETLRNITTNETKSTQIYHSSRDRENKPLHIKCPIKIVVQICLNVVETGGPLATIDISPTDNACMSITSRFFFIAQ